MFFLKILNQKFALHKYCWDAVKFGNGIYWVINYDDTG